MTRKKSYSGRKISPIHQDKLIRIFRSIGYEITANTKKHIVLRHPDKPMNLSIPNHPGHDVQVRIICQLIRNAEITRDDYLVLLDKM
jgi:predicted RNA binding protein YcfA (HicA-like mRNA interferase family)